jgi:hypothetical protein
MRGQSSRLVWSAVLIGMGILMLLNNLNLLPFGMKSENWFWVVMFGLGGAGFLTVFLSRPAQQWWAVIPSFTLLGLAFLVGDFLPAGARDLSWIGAVVFLGMIGLSFLVIMLVRPEQWWAIFPAGSLLSVSGVIAVSELYKGTENSGFAAASVLFLGLALTFFLVFLRPLDGTRMVWALWPASILGLIGLMLMLGFASLINYVWALALIAAGGAMLIRGMRR